MRRFLASLAPMFCIGSEWLASPPMRARSHTAAKRFFKKMMRAEHRRFPFSISVDKNAAYPEAFSAS